MRLFLALSIVLLSSPAYAQQAPLQGDFDGDGQVDQVQFVTLRNGECSLQVTLAAQPGKPFDLVSGNDPDICAAPVTVGQAGVYTFPNSGNPQVKTFKAEVILFKLKPPRRDGNLVYHWNGHSFEGGFIPS